MLHQVRYAMLRVCFSRVWIFARSHFSYDRPKRVSATYLTTIALACSWHGMDVQQIYGECSGWVPKSNLTNEWRYASVKDNNSSTRRHFLGEKGSQETCNDLRITICDTISTYDVNCLPTTAMRCVLLCRGFGTSNISRCGCMVSFRK